MSGGRQIDLDAAEQFGIGLINRVYGGLMIAAAILLTSKDLTPKRD